MNVRYSHDGKTFVDYHAVRIGEYYWIDKNFHHKVPQSTNSEYGRQGIENLTPTTQARLDKYMPAAELRAQDYQVNIADFDYQYGNYYDWTSVDFMMKNAKIYSGNTVFSGWKFPSYQDFKQLFGMASPNKTIRISGDPLYETLAPIGGTSSLFFNFENYSKPGRKVYWFSNTNTNKLKFNLMPTGFKMHVAGTWNNGVNGPHSAEAGDFASLFYTSYFWLGEYRKIAIVHEAISFPSTNMYSLMPARMCRRLTDEELGYKLYVNMEKKDIVKLSLTDTPSVGYSELETGYLRGFYVDKILDKINPEFTVAELIDKVNDAIESNRYNQIGNHQTGSR